MATGMVALQLRKAGDYTALLLAIALFGAAIVFFAPVVREGLAWPVLDRLELQETVVRRQGIAIAIGVTIFATILLVRLRRFGWAEVSRALLTMTIIVVAALAFIYAEDVSVRWVGQSYVAVFMFALIGAATVVLPAPAALTAISFASALEDPVGVGLVAAAGQTLGEMVSYLLGASGSRLFKKGPLYGRVHKAIDGHTKMAGGVIFVLAMMPNPLFDLVGLAAGVVRYSAWKFMVLAFFGNAVKYILVWGVLGVSTMHLLQR